MNKAAYLLLIFFALAAVKLHAQQNTVNPNGYNVFYYPNGVKSSEGYMRNGKPDGYWISYYPNGQKKAEGNRKNFLLDSTWIFYTEQGDTLKKINYYLGKKNGWYITYYTRLDSDFIANVPKSKVLYVNDVRQGVAYYYYPNGKLWKTIPYKDNLAQGRGYEYAPDGRIITIITYSYGRPVESEAINRYDQQGRKIGIWREYYPNGQIHWEATYKDGKLDGYYKEYSQFGALVKYLQYKDGRLVQQLSQKQLDSLKRGRIKLVEKKYPNGKLKFSGTFIDSLPVGYHKFYSPDQKLDSAVWYNQLGQKLGVGLLDSAGLKHGTWTLYYPEGSILAKGQYKHGKRQGKWTFFYPDGSIFQIGYYKNGKPSGQWTWYYQNGKIRRVENYFNGLLDGHVYELSPTGDTILSTFYSEGLKHGSWKLCVGDFYQIGQYRNDKPDGTWKSYYYPQMKLMCIDNYQDGRRNGLHKCYYPNGAIKEQGQYLDGKKNGKWYFYTENGYLINSITYQLDKIVKINDKKVEE